jgi:hypothetical protein
LGIKVNNLWFLSKVNRLKSSKINQIFVGLHYFI